MTKLFHFYGIFKKNDINQQNEPPPFIHMNPFPEILDPSLGNMFYDYTVESGTL